MHDPYLKQSQPGVYNFAAAVDGRSVAAVTNKK